jgi:hypothetical protein
LKKTPEELRQTHTVDPDDRWALVADKGYIGPCGKIRMIIPEKKVKNSETNKVVNRIRVNIERYFGRLKQIFSRLNYYSLGVESLETDFRICCQLINVHLYSNPLVEKDLEFYNSWLNKVFQTAETFREKKRIAQRKYITKRNSDNKVLENVAGYINDEFSDEQSEESRASIKEKKKRRTVDESDSSNSQNKQRDFDIAIPSSNSSSTNEKSIEISPENDGKKTFYGSLNKKIAKKNDIEEETSSEGSDSLNYTMILLLYVLLRRR